MKPLVIHFSVEMQLSVMVDIFEFMDYYQLLLNKPNTGNPSNLKKPPKNSLLTNIIRMKKIKLDGYFFSVLSIFYSQWLLVGGGPRCEYNL